MPVRIAIIGDFDPDMHTHVPMEAALKHAASPRALVTEWVHTTAIDYPGLRDLDGILLAPGSPYADFSAVLDIIYFARTSGVPFLGICGGFQHVLIEFAQEEVGLHDANSAEHDEPAEHHVIVPMACRLDGRYPVRIVAGTLLAEIYGGAGEFEETYFCGYQADPAYDERLEQAGLRLNARAPDGAPRGCEIVDHPFFVATAFQPQMRFGHPVMRAFVEAALHRALHRTWSGVEPADYMAHMQNTGQAQANAVLSAELLEPFAGGTLLIAGAGPGQMLDHGLSLDRFALTVTDLNPLFLTVLAERLPQAVVRQDDISLTDLTGPYDAALLVLVLEHVDWTRALACLAGLTRDWLIIIQRNPVGMTTAVTPGVTPPGTMQALGGDVPPHLVPEEELIAAAAEHGFALQRRRERAVNDGKAMVGLHFKAG